MNGSNPDSVPSIPPTKAPNYSAATLGVHADDILNDSTDVAPALHVSTTFRYTSDPDQLIPISEKEVSFHRKHHHEVVNHVCQKLHTPSITVYQDLYKVQVIKNAAHIDYKSYELRII